MRLVFVASNTDGSPATAPLDDSDRILGYQLDCGTADTTLTIGSTSGVYSGVGEPVMFGAPVCPNGVVKVQNADGSARLTLWVE